MTTNADSMKKTVEFRRAYNQNHEKAKKGDSEGIKFLRNLATGGDAEAHFHLAEICEKEKNDKEALEHYQQAERGGYSAANTRRLNLVKRLNERAPDDKAAKERRDRFADERSKRRNEILKRQTESAQKKDKEAEFALALTYDHGLLSVEANDKQAKEHYESAAKLGHDLARLKLDADAGNAKAQLDLGLAYFRGRGFPIDQRRAAHYFGEASEQRLEEAIVNSGRCHEYGYGVSQDVKKAFAYYEEAKKNADAQVSIGHCYANGIGVPADLKKSLEYYKAAADKNNADAFMMMGQAQERTQAPGSQAEALALYKKAAELGNRMARNILCSRYSFGYGGVQKDDAEMKKFMAQSLTILRNRDNLNKQVAESRIIDFDIALPEVDEKWLEEQNQIRQKEQQAKRKQEKEGLDYMNCLADRLNTTLNDPTSAKGWLDSAIGLATQAIEYGERETKGTMIGFPVKGVAGIARYVGVCRQAGITHRIARMKSFFDEKERREKCRQFAKRLFELRNAVPPPTRIQTAKLRLAEYTCLIEEWMRSGDGRSFKSNTEIQAILDSGLAKDIICFNDAPFSDRVLWLCKRVIESKGGQLSADFEIDPNPEETVGLALISSIRNAPAAAFVAGNDSKHNPSSTTGTSQNREANEGAALLFTASTAVTATTTARVDGARANESSNMASNVTSATVSPTPSPPR